MRKHGILANQKPLTCIVVVQDPVVVQSSHLLRHVILGSMRELIFLLFSDMTCKTY